MDLSEHPPANISARKRRYNKVGRSNEVIPDDEKQIVRELLSDAQGNLEALDFKIACAKRSLAAFNRQRKAAVAQMTRFNIALASEKLLPPEILSHIFLLALPETGTCARYGESKATPWTFLRVCSRWRHVALSQHGIWKRLTVEVSNGESVKSLLCHLWARSPTSSVSLDLKKLDDYNHINDILSEYSSRFQNISIDATSPTLEAVLRSAPNAFGRLETLHLTYLSDVAKDLTLRKFGNAPNLREVQIDGHRTRLSADVGLQLPWPQLVALQLTGVAFPAEKVFSTLSQCVKLTNLEITLETPDNRHGAPEILSSTILPDLCGLSIFFMRGVLGQFFQWLTAPALKNINISYKGKVNPHITSLPNFPHAEFTGMLQRSGAMIEVFSCRCPILNVNVEALLDVMPSLTSLSLENAHPVTDRTFEMMRDDGFLRDLAYLKCFTTSPQSFLSLLGHQCRHAPASKGLRSGYISYNNTHGVRERFQALEWRLLGNGKSIKFVEK